MALSHLLMEHIDICVGHGSNLRAAPQARTRQSTRGVHPFPVMLGPDESTMIRRRALSPVLSVCWPGAIPLARGGQELDKVCTMDSRAYPRLQHISLVQAEDSRCPSLDHLHKERREKTSVI